MEKFLQIGEIVNTHGLKGELKVLPLTDDVNRFDDLKWVFLDRTTYDEKLHIAAVRYYKSFVFIKFEEINDKTAADALKGLFIKVDRENAVKLSKDSFFISDLIGCEVLTLEGKSLGRLDSILKTGSNDVYIVKNNDNKEVLIPALKSVVKDISINDKRILVSLPEGLINDEI